jgi:hypothetical protein
MTLFVSSQLISEPTYDTFQFIVPPELNDSTLTTRINIPDCAGFGAFGQLSKLLVTAAVNGANEFLAGDGQAYFRMTQRGVWDVSFTTNTAGGIFTDFVGIREYRDDTGDYHDPIKPNVQTEDYVALSAGPMTPAAGDPWYGFNSLLKLQLNGNASGEWPFAVSFGVAYTGPSPTSGVIDFGDGTAPTTLPRLDATLLNVEHTYQKVGQFSPQVSAVRAGYPGNVMLHNIAEVTALGEVPYALATVTPDKSSSADPTFTFTFHGQGFGGGDAS